VVAVYQGATLAELTEIACNDQAPGSSASKVVTPLTGGTTYRIQVSSWAWVHAGVPHSTGPITTEITAGVYLPPVNDEPNGAVTLVPGAQITLDTTGATTSWVDDVFGAMFGCSGQATVWYVALSGTFDELFLDTSGTSFDSELLVLEVTNEGYVTDGWCASDGGTQDDARLRIVTAPGNNYFVRVASEDGATGMMNLTALEGTTAVPAAPTGVSAVGGDSSAQVSWTAAAPNGSPVTGYTITSSPGGVTQTVGGTVTTATVTGLTNGTSYTFTVKATNAIGTGPASTPSNAVTPAGRPQQMPAPKVVVRGSKAIVKWKTASANGSPITGYKVDISKGKDKNRPPSARKVVYKNLKPGKYKVRITASNAIGNGPYSTRTKFRIR
jgi:hypothetical protein